MQCKRYEPIQTLRSLKAASLLMRKSSFSSARRVIYQEQMVQVDTNHSRWRRTLFYHTALMTSPFALQYFPYPCTQLLSNIPTQVSPFVSLSLPRPCFLSEKNSPWYYSQNSSIQPSSLQSKEWSSLSGSQLQRLPCPWKQSMNQVPSQIICQLLKYSWPFPCILFSLHSPWQQQPSLQQKTPQPSRIPFLIVPLYLVPISQTTSCSPVLRFMSSFDGDSSLISLMVELSFLYSMTLK